MAVLTLRPEDCSAFGRWVLDYLKKNRVSMSKLADQSGLSQPGLRNACLKGVEPESATVEAIAKATDYPLKTLELLVLQDKYPSLASEVADEGTKIESAKEASDFPYHLVRPGQGKSTQIVYRLTIPLSDFPQQWARTYTQLVESVSHLPERKRPSPSVLAAIASEAVMSQAV